MRKKKKTEIEVKCDYCGDRTSYFVTTNQYKRFCRIQTPGYPAEKDCHLEYIKEKNKNVQKDEKEKSLQPQKEVSLQKEKVVKKFDDLLNHFKQKKYEKRLSQNQER